ncbi:MAG: hypothetical protein WC623_10200 [Pedobacter sp.]|uniref:hypothetical protein n=1 Tax=Pedobacter sp. TaxID=1411316 RepID=UPI0035614C8C
MTYISQEKFWACLIHIGYNMWEDHDRFKHGDNLLKRTRYFCHQLRFDQDVWNNCVKRMVDSGLNMIVLDLGDAVQYSSVPEIAVEGAWSIAKLKGEISKLRDVGIEPIPKLNFSTGHDAWLRAYSRMVSTEQYYNVCRALIAEVTDVFKKPRFFHLGFDEENARHQISYDYASARAGDLWWHDLNFFIKEVEKGGSRPWIWADHSWDSPDDFYARMPKNVLQSNWYYRQKFDDVSNKQVKAYLELEKHGYDQVPTSGYFELNKGEFLHRQSANLTAEFTKKHVSDNHLLGFLQTCWRPTIKEYERDILLAIDYLGESKTVFYGESVGR